MAGHAIAEAFDRERLADTADWLAVAVAVSLPWSTSATSILIVAWLCVLVPTLTWPDVRRELTTAVGGLPVLLFLLGALGMIWAEVPWAERWRGLEGFAKLVVLPLLIVQFRRSNGGNRVLLGFLFACVALLAASVAVTMWPGLPHGGRNTGVPVKTYIVQSAEFVICAAVLFDVAVAHAIDRRWRSALGPLLLAIAFVSDILFIATSRTTLVILPILVLVFGVRRFGWKGLVAISVAGLILAGTVWSTSPYLRNRVEGIVTELNAPTTKGLATSAGERVVFWTKSLGFIASAPLLGHGTGSVTAMFRQAAVGETGMQGEVTSNPHNLTFAVAIQIGLVGAAVLWAMWIAQLYLFRGPGVVAWIGLVVVVQNLVGSLFNSFIFDFTEGWLYVFGVGVVAGMVRRRQDAQQPSTG